MEYRRLANTLLDVSLLGLGCNNFGWICDGPQSTAVVRAALEQGVTLFDTADIYGEGRSEVYLGRVLGKNRKRVVIATKFGLSHIEQRQARAAPSYIIQAAERSLRRLGTDYLDIYQVHFPDPDTPIEQTLLALERLTEQGKVRVAGCSNYSVGQLRAANHVASRRGIDGFKIAQNEYSLLNPSVERFMLPEIRTQGIGFLAYYPLANGLLTGKYGLGDRLPSGTRLARSSKLASELLTPRTRRKLKNLAELSLRLNRPLSELALSWVAAHHEVTSVLVGATSQEQVIQNAGAVCQKLREEEIVLLNQAARSTRPEAGPARY